MSAALSSGLLRPLHVPLPPSRVCPRLFSCIWSRRQASLKSLALSTEAAETVVQSGASNGTLPGSAPSFQDAVIRLQKYWSSNGCVVWQPHNTEVGAGTMNPATFLRVLGVEPWRVCYAEPSVRPDDSRYGENPNRVQRHTQFQVILKPDPGNAQELFLGSLEALGIDTAAHDVRFVEDNWESPALGAWGLGWEVWLDGMEVTQFTYFQQAGSQVMEVPSVEITYGLERILMALQGVHHFKDIRYNDGITYGELFLQNEYEMSAYNMDYASVASLRERFSLFEAEAKEMLEKRLPIPAYDHVLKLSHTFNTLDSRGAVGFTERQEIFARIRGLAKSVAALWVERRAELEQPLGTVQPVEAPPVPEAKAEELPAAADFVLEIGTEELPPSELESAMIQLQESLPPLLERLRLEHTGVNVQGTPRRIAAMIQNLAPRQITIEEQRRGPPRKRAYDDAGEPTKALTGFCKSNGADVSDVFFQPDAKGTEYCCVIVKQVGQPSGSVMANELAGLVKSIKFKKAMRWNPKDDVTFSRPVRWLLAMHGTTVVPFGFGVLRSGSKTRLMRGASPSVAELRSASEYVSVLQQGGICVETDKRKSAIWDGVVSSAAVRISLAFNTA